MDEKLGIKVQLIHEWLDQEVRLKARKSETKILIEGISDIIERLPSSYVNFEIEMRALRGWFESYQLNYQEGTSSKLESTEKEVIHVKDVTKRRVIAFFCDRGYSEKVGLIRSVYFFICLKMVTLTKHGSRINTTLDECRFLNTSHRKFLVQFLPDIRELKNLDELLNIHQGVYDLDLYDLWQSIDSDDLNNFIIGMRSKPHKDDDESWSDRQLCNHRVRKYLYNFIYPVSAVLQQKQGIKRNVVTTSATPEVIRSDAYIDEETGDVTATLSSINQHIEEHQTDDTFEIDERVDDDVDTAVEYRPKRPTSYYMDMVRAQQQVNMRRKRSMHLITDVQVAKEYEITVFIKEIYEILRKIDIDYSFNSSRKISLSNDQISAIYLLVTLLMGNEGSALAVDFEEIYDRCIVHLQFTPDRSRLNDDYSLNLSAVETDQFLLTLPFAIGVLACSLQQQLGNSKQRKQPQSLNSVMEIARGLLIGINKKHKTKLSIRKLSGYLKHKLLNEGIDSAVIEVMTQSPINHLSALPYFNIGKGEVYLCQYIYFTHLKDIMQMHLNDHSPSERLNHRNTLEINDLVDFPGDRYTHNADRLAGTKLSLNESKFKSEVIGPMVIELKSLAIKYDDIEGMIEHHNLFMDYLYIMLGLSSGYRPVVETFGRFQDVDLDTGVYFISDKENRAYAQGRFIVLPEITTKQLQAYYEELYHRMKFFKRKQRSLGDLYQDIYESNVGIISYLELNSDGKCDFIKNQNRNFIINRLKRHFHLPLNWYRHHMRSLKDFGYSLFKSGHAENDFNYEVVNSWMGHSDPLGFDYYDVFSSLKRTEQKKMASYIHKLLLDYGFELIELNRGKRDVRN
ncbi:hypothetical protein [Psychrobacter sanguinis]|uniref:hypothetical protein n=1 Tax=Psychrobacter sanguinis TaxID=861445 RepID=UPI00289D4527|nr:hypothetical protein [Psychrobacter sanguinis]